MTTPPTFDQQVSGWLEDGPVDAPDGTLETILVAFPSLPQRRAAWRAPWRTSSMSGLVRALAAFAAVVVIIAAAFTVLPRLQPGSVGGLPSPLPATPSLSPTLTPTPSASPIAKPSPTVKPPPSPSASVAVTSPACLGGDLAARVMDWQGAAGTRFGTLRLQNVGTSNCLISGTPGIQLVDSQGQVFLDSANLGNPASASPAKPVFTLRAGGASSIYLMAGLTNYCGADPAAPVRLALVLPASLGRLVATAPAGVEITMAPCNGSTVSTELHVQVPWSTRAP